MFNGSKRMVAFGNGMLEASASDEKWSRDRVRANGAVQVYGKRLPHTHHAGMESLSKRRKSVAFLPVLAADQTPKTRYGGLFVTRYLLGVGHVLVWMGQPNYQVETASNGFGRDTWPPYFTGICPAHQHIGGGT